MKYLCLDLKTCALIVGGIDGISTILFLITYGYIVALIKVLILGSLFYGILAKKPPCLIPFLIANCATILGGILGIVLLFVSPSDTATTNAGEDYTTSMTNEDDPVQGHRFIFISVAVVIILLNIHGWLVIFALYKSYSHPENKVVDNVMAEVAASYPPLQSVTKNMDAVRSSVATIDDGLRFTYK